MPFIIETWDKPDSKLIRATLRPAHLSFLQANAKLLLACGAKLIDDGTDLGGGLYVVDVEDRPNAEAFITSDPFYVGGLFRHVQITRWRKAYVAGQSFL